MRLAPSGQDFYPEEVSVIKCYICEKDIKRERDAISDILFDTPWQNKGEINYFCSEDCYDKLFDHSYSDFRYFHCDSCNRLICEQNPANGWHIQFRYYNGIFLCLKCFQDEILKNGTNPECFEDGQLEGMFFSEGNSELLEVGYKEYGSYYINSEDSASRLCNKALSLIRQNYKVVIAYEALGIGGLEGHVTLYIKH